jgi:hypothetical protein
MSSPDVTPVRSPEARSNSHILIIPALAIFRPGRLEPTDSYILIATTRIATGESPRPIGVIQSLLVTSGPNVVTLERHDAALATTIEQIQTTLRALKILALSGIDSRIVKRAIYLAGKAAEVEARGDAGYLLIVAERRDANLDT